MFKYIVKISSITGQVWKAIFRKHANRIAAGLNSETARKSGRVTTMKTSHDGFIALHSLRKDQVTTKVIDIPGVLLCAFTSDTEKTPFGGVVIFLQRYASSFRDAFNTMIAIEKQEGQEEDAYSVEANLIEDIVSHVVYGSKLPYKTSFVMTSAPIFECDGISVSQAVHNIELKTDTYKYGILRKHDEFYAYLISHVGIEASKRKGTVTSRLMLISQDSTLSDYGFGLIQKSFKDSRVCRQVPGASACHKKRRQVSFSLLIEKGEATPDFPHSCGRIGVLIICSTIIKNKSTGIEEFKNVNKFIRIDQMNIDPISIEKWSEGGADKWRQEYTVIEIDENGDPKEVSYAVRSGPAYLIKDNEFTDETPNMPGYISCAFGRAVSSFVGNDAICLIDLRVTRSWQDNRGLDIHPDVKPVSLQTQTGVIEIKINFPGDDISSVGSPSVSLLMNDVSGSKESGSYAALGGTNTDYHAIWRAEWAGVVKGKKERHVALISEVRHSREEQSAPNEFLRHTDSGLFYDDSRLFVKNDDGEWIYWSSINRIPYQFEQLSNIKNSSAIILYTDGNKKYLEGYSLVFNRSEMERFNYWQPIDSHSFGTVISESLVWFAAYVYKESERPTHVALLEWDIDSGSVRELRRDPAYINGIRQRPALSCYQREYDTGSKVYPPGVIYRLGNQVGPGFVKLTKDYGVSWVDILTPAKEYAAGYTHSPAFGVFYLGSTLWSPEYGKAFQQYMGGNK